jgi:hypothetical protein
MVDEELTVVDAEVVTDSWSLRKPLFQQHIFKGRFSPCGFAYSRKTDPATCKISGTVYRDTNGYSPICAVQRDALRAAAEFFGRARNTISDLHSALEKAHRF